MRISELASAAELPVATVKYYLRENLLHDGELISATQARYDHTHIKRLKLIRALISSAGLSIAATRELLAGLDNPPASTHALLGLAHRAVAPENTPSTQTEGVDQLLHGWGWNLGACAPDTRAALAAALEALAGAGFELPPQLLTHYAQTMHSVAEAEIDNVPTTSPEEAIRYVALGTVLIEPVLLALRRLAQQDASSQRFAGETDSARHLPAAENKIR